LDQSGQSWILARDGLSANDPVRTRVKRPIALSAIASDRRAVFALENIERAGNAASSPVLILVNDSQGRCSKHINKGDLRDVGEDKVDPKLTMLFMLIGAIISLSHLGDENLANIKRRWRNVVSTLLLASTRKT
jgi:hypothetical protein